VAASAYRRDHVDPDRAGHDPGRDARPQAPDRAHPSAGWQIGLGFREQDRTEGIGWFDQGMLTQDSHQFRQIRTLAGPVRVRVTAEASPRAEGPMILPSPSPSMRPQLREGMRAFIADSEAVVSGPSPRRVGEG
jgi:hypothetical protein